MKKEGDEIAEKLQKLQEEYKEKEDSLKKVTDTANESAKKVNTLH